MKLSRTVAYAIGATLQLASDTPDRPISAKSLANSGAAPKRFLLHILRLLVTRGILVSSRGAEGGYRLARPPSQITLLQIIEAFDKTTSPTLPDVRAISSEIRQRLCKSLQDASESARSELRRLTLADLMAAADHRNPQVHAGLNAPHVPHGQTVARKKTKKVRIA